jgi:hypothetical protein
LCAWWMCFSCSVVLLLLGSIVWAMWSRDRIVCFATQGRNRPADFFITDFCLPLWDIYIYAISGFFFFEHPIVLRQDGKAGGTSLAPVYAFWQSCVSMSRCAETSFFFFFFFGCASSYYGVGSMRCPRGWQA